MLVLQLSLSTISPSSPSLDKALPLVKVNKQETIIDDRLLNAKCFLMQPKLLLLLKMQSRDNLKLFYPVNWIDMLPEKLEESSAELVSALASAPAITGMCFVLCMLCRMRVLFSDVFFSGALWICFGTIPSLFSYLVSCKHYKQEETAHYDSPHHTHIRVCARITRVLIKSLHSCK
jgi:hypothetical protein